MNASNPTLVTLEVLVNLVADILATGYEEPANGQVRAVPDVRTIRYYTTIGLVDRPLAMQGRTGLYGWRHVLQLVAIKRLQAEGLSLVEIQQRLIGMPDQQLAALAQLPAVNTQFAPSESTTPRDGNFWKTRPAPVAASGPPTPTAAAAINLLQGIELGTGITLLITPSRTIQPDDLEAIRQAAVPLLNCLTQRQIS
jgi:DNA-binding transcriptional MerR regulator